MFPEISVINIALATANLLLVFMNLAHLDSMYKWDHTIYVLLWLISLSISHQGIYMHIVTNDRISFFYRLNNIPVCVCVCVCVYITSHPLYPFLCWHLFSCLSYNGYLTMNMEVQISLWGIDFISSGYTLRGDIVILYSSSSFKFFEDPP